MPTPSATVPSPSVAGGTGPSTPPAGTITWSVQPSSATGPDRRSTFTYNDLKPVTVVHDYVGVTNFSKLPVTFRIYAEDAFTNATGSLDLLPATEKPKDVGAWVSVDHDTVTIPPGARLNEPFTLSIPAGATPGDHTGGLIASISVTGASSGVTVDRRLAVPILLRVSGPLQPGLAVESLSTDFHGTANPFGGGGTDVSYTIHNTGNTRMNVSQTVTVTGPFGLTMGTAHPADVADLLPGATLRVTEHVNGVFPAGPMGAHVHLDPSELASLPAADKAPVAVVNDAGFWATPWPQLLVLALLVGVFFGVRWLLRRNRDRTRAVVNAAVAKARTDSTRQLATSSAPATGSAPTDGSGPATDSP